MLVTISSETPIKWCDWGFAPRSRYFCASPFLASGNAGGNLLGTPVVLAVVFATRTFGGFRKARGISGRVNRLRRLAVEPVGKKCSQH
jgi:hypothetical protein